MQCRFVLAGLVAAGLGDRLAAGQPELPAHAQNTVASNAARLQPPLPPSPIDYFRQLLIMPPAEREKVLATKSPQHRQALEVRLRQYDDLTPEERDIRLQGLKLRYYLLPLMKAPLSNRADRLMAIPAADRRLVEERLRHWDQQPKELQNEILENEQMVRTIFTSETNSVPPQQGAELESQIQRWNSLSHERQREIREHWKGYFELNEREKEKTLNGFSAAERQQMERTLKTFERLPPAQREQCIVGFQRFTELSPEQRQAFLRNAQHWQEMSPKDRQMWRVLVSTFSVPRPPLPAAPRRSFPALPSKAPPFVTNQ